MYYLELPQAEKETYQYGDNVVSVYIEDGFYFMRPEQGKAFELFGEKEIIDFLTTKNAKIKNGQTKELIAIPDRIPIFSFYQLKIWLVAKWEYITETYLQSSNEDELQNALKSFLDGNIKNATIKVSQIKQEMESERTAFTPNLDKALEAHEQFIEWLGKEETIEHFIANRTARPPFSEGNAKSIHVSKNLPEKLSHKQQTLLLEHLGFFDLPKFTNLTTEKKGILLSYLLNRNEKNSTEYFRNFFGVKNVPKNMISKTKKNKEKVNELLSSLGFKNNELVQD